MNALDFARYKELGRKISMVTCYDHWSASIINESSIDTILVGDSVAMVVHGHSTTVGATTEMMALHTAAVVRGAPDKFIVGDLPFLSYRKGLESSMQAVETLMRAGAHALKLEGWPGNEELVRHMIQSGVPTIVHLGMTPQSIHSLGGFRLQTKTAREADLLIEQAIAAEQSGALAIVLECIPPDVAERVTRALTIPTIGIGAGPHTDGQVLVLQDLLGMDPRFKPKFLRHYMKGRPLILDALETYHRDVQEEHFPNEQESYPCLKSYAN